MPKQKITQEMILDAAFDRLREKGIGELSVTSIASDLGCSVQPIYSYCSSMEGLRTLLADRVNEFVAAYVKRHIDPDDLFRSLGHAHALLAKEERHVFEAFVFQTRTGIESLADLYAKYATPEIAQNIASELQISLKAAEHLHLNMIVYTLGLGIIYASAKPGLSADETFALLEQAQDAFRKQALEKKI